VLTGTHLRFVGRWGNNLKGVHIILPNPHPAPYPPGYPLQPPQPTANSKIQTIKILRKTKRNKNWERLNMSQKSTNK